MEGLRDDHGSCLLRLGSADITHREDPLDLVHRLLVNLNIACVRGRQLFLLVSFRIVLPHGKLCVGDALFILEYNPGLRLRQTANKSCHLGLLVCFTLHNALLYLTGQELVALS